MVKNREKGQLWYVMVITRIWPVSKVWISPTYLTSRRIGMPAISYTDCQFRMVYEIQNIWSCSCVNRHLINCKIWFSSYRLNFNFFWDTPCNDKRNETWIDWWIEGLENCIYLQQIQISGEPEISAIESIYQLLDFSVIT